MNSPIKSSNLRPETSRRYRRVDSRNHVRYQHQTGKSMTTPSMAQMLSNTLYYKRFFPYYAFNARLRGDREHACQSAKPSRPSAFHPKKGLGFVRFFFTTPVVCPLCRRSWRGWTRMARARCTRTTRSGALSACRSRRRVRARATSSRVRQRMSSEFYVRRLSEWVRLSVRGSSSGR